MFVTDGSPKTVFNSLIALDIVTLGRDDCITVKIWEYVAKRKMK